jgi:hypothetical protein
VGPPILAALLTLFAASKGAAAAKLAAPLEPGLLMLTYRVLRIWPIN